jgi:nucleoside-diphosphate-sugar epimerase
MSPDPEKVISAAVKLTETALEAASKEPSIKRFVLTSSSSAAVIPDPSKGRIVIEKGR